MNENLYIAHIAHKKLPHKTLRVHSAKMTEGTPEKLMLLNPQRQNYTTSACKVQNVLYKFGFGVVWEMQGVGNVNLFRRV